MPGPIKQTERLELEKDLGKSPLMVYFFIVSPPEIQIKNEKCVAIMSYNLEMALARAQMEAKGLGLFYTGQKTPVTELISKLHLEGIVSPPIQGAEIIEPLPEPKMKKQNFIYGLMLATEKFIENPEDKKKLKEILKKVGKED